MKRLLITNLKNEEMPTSIDVYQYKIVTQKTVLDYHKTAILDLI
jgi:hypothetical protein